jgi:DNA repair exonuclease SbcCD ATPase subunit
MWRIQHITRLEKLESELKTFLTIDFDSELQKFAALEEWEKANAKIEAEIRSFEKDLEVASNNHARILAEIQSLKSQTEFSNKKTIQLREGSIARYQQEIARKTQALEFIAQDIQALTHSLENPLEHECSQCGQSLNGTDHLEQVLKNIQSLLEAKALEYQETEVSIKELNDSILHTQEEIKKLQRDELEKQARNSDRIQALTSDLDKSQLQVALYQQKIQTQKQQLSALPSKPQMQFKTKNQLFESKNAYEQLLKDLNTELEKTDPYAEQSQELKTSGLQPISYDNINELNKLREHQEFLLKLLTSKESFIRKKIIDQNISYLNARLNHYLDKLGLPHEVKFLNDLSVEIFYLGRELDFDNLSRGERTRLILGLSWSFRDVYESLNLPINLLFIDELLDSGLDISGLENSLELIKKMGRERGKNIFLISHKDELTSRVNNLLYVRKENGFTTFDTGEENA